MTTGTVQEQAVASAGQRDGRGRRVARRIVLGLVTVLAFLLTGGALEGLVTGTDDGVHRVHDTVHAVWLGLLVLLPYAVQWRRPESKIAPWQAIAVGSVVLVVTAPLAGVDDPAFVVGFPLFALLIGLTHPARRQLLRAGEGLSPVLAPLAGIAAVPASLYAVDQMRLQRVLEADLHGELLHYASQSITALMLVAFAAVAAVRTPGWQWPALSATVGAGAWGLASLLAPGQSGSLGTGGGAALLLGTAVFGAASLWEHRRG